MKQPISIVENHGGQSIDLKHGQPGSFSYSRHIDFRKSPTSLSILPKTVKETGSTVTELLTEMIQLPSGKMVAIGDSGGVYTRATNGTWAKDGTTLTDTSAGMHYSLQQDTIYVPGLNNLHSITNADGRFSGGSFTVNDFEITANVDKSATDSTNTYTTTNAISEAGTHKLSVIPAVEPMYSIKLWITTKGSDDITVTMHDAANNTLATVTKTAAQLTNGALNEFVFTTPVRNTVKPNASTYHFHVTHATSSATTIGTATASDLSTARYETYANRFVNPKNGFHPAIEFLQYMLIGNERYLAAWEIISQSDPANTELDRHRLVFPSGYEVTSIATWTEFAAIACGKTSSLNTNEFQAGKIFFWDGTAGTYNFIIDVPEGTPYSIFSHKNTLYWFAGGGWWAWSGGQPVKLFQMPNTDTEFTDVATYRVNNPHTMAVRNGILIGAFPSETSSTEIEHGVYSFGSRMRQYPESFGFSYTISTGKYLNSESGEINLGFLKSFGDKAFLSWKDDESYGVDLISPASDPFPSAVWESRIVDNTRPDKQKQATHMEITFEALPTGATVTPKYKIDRGSWVLGTDSGQSFQGAATQTKVKFPINKRYKEIQLGHNLAATTASPDIISVSLIWDTLASEED
jgi:hypothetical protein